MGSPDHNAPLSDAPQQKVRETAVPLGTVPKVAGRQKPYVYELVQPKIPDEARCT